MLLSLINKHEYSVDVIMFCLSFNILNDKEMQQMEI